MNLILKREKYSSFCCTFLPYQRMFWYFNYPFWLKGQKSQRYVQGSCKNKRLVTASTWWSKTWSLPCFFVTSVCQVQRRSLISANLAQTLSDFKKYWVLISVNLWINSDKSKVISNYKDDSDFESTLKYTAINNYISFTNALKPQGLCNNHCFCQSASSFNEAD